MRNPEFDNTTQCGVLNDYLATAIAEGFCEGTDASQEDQIKAWAHLIRTGLCWRLQGSFGRTADSLIQSGVISPNGVIDWEQFDEVLTQ